MADDNSRPLFRKVAIDNQRERLHGEILLVPRLSYTLITALLLGWLLITTIWLVNSRFSQKETVLGWIDPPSGVVRIFPQEMDGQIDSLTVQEGDFVQQGEPLAVVTSGRVLASGSSLTSELLKEYERQKQTIARQLKRGELMAAGKTQRLRAQAESAESELTLIDRQINTVIKRDALLTSQSSDASTLEASGFISTNELESFQTQKLTLRESLQELQRARVQQLDLINQYQTELTLIPQEAANEQDILNDRLSIISQSVAQLRSQQTYTIVAPRAGIVNNLQVVEGQQLNPDRQFPLMTILPNESTLRAQLMVPVRSAGFLQEKQEFVIRYDAFPYQKFGMQSGTIQTISKTLLLPHEVLNAPIEISEPVYRVVGELSAMEVQAFGKTFALKPGMTLAADIKLGERSLIEWIFEPLLSLRGSI